MTNEPADGLVTELRELAERLARGAGTLAHDGRTAAESAEQLDGTTKSSRTDLVTTFDRAAEALIVDTLRDLRPDDAIVGEEGTADVGTSGFEWFIDPIDGTTNFVYDQPAWSTSVAVAHHGRMLAGAVYAPRTDEMFSAGHGHGATRNGTAIAANPETDLSLALVGTGFAYGADTRTVQAARVVELIGQVRDIRRLGSAALDLCFVACGRLDIYYEQHLNSWDAAAGELIAREAGAITSDFSGGTARPDEMIAAAPGVHAAFLDLFERA